MHHAQPILILSLLIPILACGGGGSSTQETPPAKGWGTASLIESNNSGSISDSPRIVVLSNGNAYSVWSQSDGVRSNIYANAYTPGSGWGNPTLLEAHDEGDAWAPRIVANSSGMLMATWVQDDGNHFNVWANAFTPGTGWGTAVQIESHSFGASSDPHVAIDSAGNAIVVWRGDRETGGGDTDIWTNRFTAGSGWGTATLLETDDSISADSPQVVMDSTGQALAVWHQNNGTQLAILARHADASGTWGSLETVQPLSSSAANQTSLGVNASGRAMLLWSHSEVGIFHLSYSAYAPGTGWSTPQGIDTGPNSAYNPFLALDGFGNALAAWAKSDGTRTHTQVSQYTSANGWSTPNLIESDNTGGALSPQATLDGNGIGFVVWAKSDGTRYNIWGARYQPSSGWESPSLLEKDNTGDAVDPSLGMDGQGHAMATWRQFDGVRYNAFANRYR